MSLVWQQSFGKGLPCPPTAAGSGSHPGTGGSGSTQAGTSPKPLQAKGFTSCLRFPTCPHPLWSLQLGHQCLILEIPAPGTCCRLLRCHSGMMSVTLVPSQCPLLPPSPQCEEAVRFQRCRSSSVVMVPGADSPQLAPVNSICGCWTPSSSSSSSAVGFPGIPCTLAPSTGPLGPPPRC